MESSFPLKSFYTNLRLLRGSKSFQQYIIMRSDLKNTLHRYFQDNHFTHIDRPVLTRYIQDMSKKSFQIQKPFSKSPESEAFGHPVYLSPSGQLHLEMLNSSFKRVYSIMPRFDPSAGSSRELKEFWSIDCEEAFLSGEEGFESLVFFAERTLRSVIVHFLNQNDRVQSYDINQRAEDLLKMLEKPFPHLTYDEAIQILSKHKDELKYNYTYGNFLTKKAEIFLVEYFGNSPLVLTKHPYFLKSFNSARLAEDFDKVLTFVLLVPELGELLSGGIREQNFDRLTKSLKEYDAVEYFSWFANLKSWGSHSSGGFSMGLERLLMFTSANNNIRNFATFPRAYKFCPS